MADLTSGEDIMLASARQTGAADLWGALSCDLRRVVDGWYVHEDDLRDTLRCFGLLAAEPGGGAAGRLLAGEDKP